MEKYLQMFGIHKADWAGCGAFANRWQMSYAKQMLYNKELGGDMKQGNRCPKCGRIVMRYRKKDKTYICGSCPWEGQAVKRPENESPGPNTE